MYLEMMQVIQSPTEPLKLRLSASTLCTFDIVVALLPDSNPSHLLLFVTFIHHTVESQWPSLTLCRDFGL
jgi:hypothetical protein